MYITRLARVDDARGIAEVQMKSWTDRGLSILDASELSDIAESWAHSITHQQSEGRILVVEWNGTVIGFAAVVNTGDPQLFALTALEVHPQERRKQVGSRLINASSDVARGFGANGLQAWIGDSETPAILLLEASGWRRTGAERVISSESHKYEHRTEFELQTYFDIETK